MNEIAKTFISVVLIICAFFLFFLGIDKIHTGNDISNIGVSVSEDDITLYNELILLSESPLDYLDENIEKISSGQGIGLGRLKINYMNDGIRTLTDQIGEYRDISININGDIFEQIYTIKMLLNNFQKFLLVNSIDGNKKSLVINARIYGKK